MSSVASSPDHFASSAVQLAHVVDLVRLNQLTPTDCTQHVNIEAPEQRPIAVVVCTVVYPASTGSTQAIQWQYSCGSGLL